MALKLIISPDRYWCTGKVLDLIDRNRSFLARRDVLWLVPSRRAGEAVGERLLQSGSAEHHRGVFLPDIKTLPAWTEGIYRRMDAGKTLIEDRARETIIRHLLDKGKSSYLKNPGSPGIIAGITRFVIQTRLNGLSTAEVAHRMRKFNLHYNGADELSNKDRFLLGILEDYKNFLQEKMSLDREETVNWLTEGLVNKDPGIIGYISRYKTLIPDGFYFLAASQQKLIEVLIRVIPDTVLPVHTKPSCLIDGIKNYSISDSYLSFIQEMIKKHAPQWEVKEKSLSAADNTPVLLDKPLNRVEEVRKIARAIKATLLENPRLSPHRLAVIFPSLDIYEQLIHEIFPRYGIPYRLKIRLSRSPLAHAFKKILDLRCQGFLREDLEELLSYDFIRFNPSCSREELTEFSQSMKLQVSGETTFDFFAFSDLCRRANVSGGDDFIKDWWEPIRRYLKGYLESKKSEVMPLEEIGDCLFYLKQLHTLLRRLPDPLSPAVFRDTVLDIAGFLNLLSSVNCPDAQAREALKRDMASLGRIGEVLQELTVHLQFLPDTKYPLKKIRTLFLRYLARSEFFVPEHKQEIPVLNLAETGGLYFDTVFIGGVVEGELPCARERDIFYPTGSARMFLRADRSLESRFLFYGLLENCGRRIYLFAPRSHDEKILFPSPLADSHWIKLSDTEEIYSRQEFLQLIAHTNTTKKRHLLEVLRKIDPKAYKQIKRVLKIEKMRLEPQLSPYEGILQNPENIARLKEQFTFSKENPCHYSVSQLETYARCPMQYFFSRILGLRPVPPVVEEMEADVRGKLVHKILEQYYRGISGKDFSDQEFLRKKLKQTAHRILDELSPPFYNAFWEGERRKLLSGLDGKEESPGILLQFWQNEQGQYTHPVSVEFSFGEEIPFRIDGIKLIGRIDRIDYIPESPSFIFFDYKTGKIPDLEDITKGLSFQIPVYLMALADYLNQRRAVHGGQAVEQGFPECIAGAGGYYAINDREAKIKAFWGKSSVEPHLRSGSRKNRFFSDAILEEELTIIRDRIYRIDQAIKGGKFHLPLIDPADVPCKWCDFKKICRYDPD